MTPRFTATHCSFLGTRGEEYVFPKDTLTLWTDEKYSEWIVSCRQHLFANVEKHTYESIKAWLDPEIFR